MEDYSIADQLSIGANARHVVAIHGATMSFLALNKVLASIIEIAPPNVYHELYPRVLGAHTKKYYSIMQSFDEAVAHKGWAEILRFKNTPFELSIDLLERALDAVRNE